jgi:hypothetical protein
MSRFRLFCWLKMTIAGLGRQDMFLPFSDSGLFYTSLSPMSCYETQITYTSIYTKKSDVHVEQVFNSFATSRSFCKPRGKVEESKPQRRAIHPIP